MYAIIISGGKQYKVSEGDTLDVPTLPIEIGEQVTIDKVLMIGNDKDVVIGKPIVEEAIVTATIKSHGRGKKIIVYKHKKNYKRKQGHRQGYTRLHVDKIRFGSEAEYEIEDVSGIDLTKKVNAINIEGVISTDDVISTGDIPETDLEIIEDVSDIDLTKKEDSHGT
ncbi:MAG: 50S ribosomal protein L21 [Anaerolineaceae bacterium 4572_78]|nr:MAG: 50S ribosomal protein L21 [Anaerolineaceae bacterium 4572_78]